MQLISLFTKTSILIFHTPAYTINPLVKKYATKQNVKHTPVYIYICNFIHIYTYIYKRGLPLRYARRIRKRRHVEKWITTKTTSGKTRHKRQLSFLRLKWGITYRRFRHGPHPLLLWRESLAHKVQAVTEDRIDFLFRNHGAVFQQRV